LSPTWRGAADSVIVQWEVGRSVGRRSVSVQVGVRNQAAGGSTTARSWRPVAGPARGGSAATVPGRDGGGHAAAAAKRRRRLRIVLVYR